MLPLPLACVVAKIIIFPPVFTAVNVLPENTFIYNSGLKAQGQVFFTILDIFYSSFYFSPSGESLYTASLFRVCFTDILFFLIIFHEAVEFCALVAVEAVLIEGVTDLCHHRIVEIQIVQYAKAHAEHFFCL